MLQPRLAGRYAKSLIDLAVESNQLETVYADLLFLQSAIKQSRELLNLLRSPIIKADKKNAILEAVTADKLSKLTIAFNRLLVQKGRESVLPEIVNAAIDQYNKIKGISKVKLTTAQPISADLQAAIQQKVKQETGFENIQLEVVVKDELIGGFMLEFNNNLVDASILRDLKDLQKQFKNNAYVQDIR